MCKFYSWLKTYCSAVTTAFKNRQLLAVPLTKLLLKTIHVSHFYGFSRPVASNWILKSTFSWTLSRIYSIAKFSSIHEVINPLILNFLSNWVLVFTICLNLETCSKVKFYPLQTSTGMLDTCSCFFILLPSRSCDWYSLEPNYVTLSSFECIELLTSLSYSSVLLSPLNFPKYHLLN